jgi:nitrate/nitrite-specific signal transduction histidine kinase
MTMGDAINQAGRQRMLTQRIIKAYAMIGDDVATLKGESQRTKAVTLFEQQMTNLEAFAPNDEVVKALIETKTRWQAFKELATAPAKKDLAQKVRSLGNKTLTAAHQTVLRLQEASGTNAGRLVNIAGRQRMLSQRLAGLYLYKAWGIEDSSLDSDYQAAQQQFSDALKELLGAAENTPEITAELKRVATNWKMFQRSAQLKKGQYIPLLILHASDRVLKMMNEITGMYANIADQKGTVGKTAQPGNEELQTYENLAPGNM